MYDNFNKIVMCSKEERCGITHDGGMSAKMTKVTSVLREKTSTFMADWKFLIRLFV